MGFNEATNVGLRSTVVGGRIEAGYNLLSIRQAKSIFQLTPFVAIAPTHIIQGGTSEYFGGYGKGFHYGATKNTALPIFVGAEISGDIDLGNKARLTPYLRLSWVTDVASPQSMSSQYSAANGPSIYTNGSPSFGNALIIKGGAQYSFDDNLSAYFTVDIERGFNANSYRGIGGTVGLRYSW